MQAKYTNAYAHMHMYCIPSLFQKLHFGDSTPPGLGLVV